MSNWPLLGGDTGKLLTTVCFEMDKVMIYRVVKRHRPSLCFECIKHGLDIYNFFQFDFYHEIYTIVSMLDFILKL